MRLQPARVDELLASVTWSFPRSDTRSSIHSLHPYPARFIAEIPRALIQLFPPREGTFVMDPFCGSGTTLVEAQDAGMPALGIDLHPLACLLSRVKTRPLAGDLLIEGARVASDARNTPAAVPSIPRLDHWFEPAVQEALASIVAQVSMVEDPTIR